MTHRCHLINIIVVGSIAAVALIYSVTLALCATGGIKPDVDLLAALKDTGLVALGALGTLLARTGSQEPISESDKPEPTEVLLVPDPKTPKK